MKERIEVTDQIVSPHAAATALVSSRGTTSVERVFSLVVLGDLVSLYLAVLRGVDPTPVPGDRAAQERASPTLTQPW